MSPLTDLSEEDHDNKVEVKQEKTAKKKRGRKRKLGDHDGGQQSSVDNGSSRQKKLRTGPVPSEERIRELLGADGRFEWPDSPQNAQSVSNDKASSY